MAIDRRVILEQAFGILQEYGLENLTLRRLAARLGVKAPAIYWHFKNKQDLLDEMATQVFREALREAPQYDAAQTWQDWARSYLIGLRRALLRYREGAKIFSGTYLTDASLYAAMDASLAKLTGAGFSLRQAVMGMSAMYSFTVGFVIEEQAISPVPDEVNARYQLAQRDARIDKELYPLAFAAGAEIFGGEAARFEEALELIVLGMAAQLETSGRAV
jgi:TetR/AcrR family transcriptional regulator, tetracycline repressor protein